MDLNTFRGQTETVTLPHCNCILKYHNISEKSGNYERILKSFSLGAQKTFICLDSSKAASWIKKFRSMIPKGWGFQGQIRFLGSRNIFRGP